MTISLHTFLNSEKTDAEVIVAYGEPGEYQSIAEVRVRIRGQEIWIECKDPMKFYAASPRLRLRVWEFEDLLKSLEERP